jgi:hypothetical protein
MKIQSESAHFIFQTVADLAPRARLVEQFVLERDQERDTLNRVPA